jgi:hypothetical protein
MTPAVARSPLSAWEGVVPLAAATPWEYAMPSLVVRTEISGMVIEAIPGPYRPGSACAVLCGGLRMGHADHCGPC